MAAAKPAAKSPNSATRAPRKPAKRVAKPAAAKAEAATPKSAPKAAVKPAPAKRTAAPKAAAKPAPRKQATKAATPAKRKSRTGLISAITVGVLAAGSAAALLARRFLTPGNAEHAAPDLALDAAPAGTDRAPAMFRPDPTAEVPAAERDAMRPATLPIEALTTH